MIQNIKEKGVAAAPSAKSPKSTLEVIGNLGRGKKESAWGTIGREKLRWNPSADSVILIFSRQKPCTRII